MGRLDSTRLSQCIALAMALVLPGLNAAHADDAGLESSMREKASAIEDKYGPPGSWLIIYAIWVSKCARKWPVPGWLAF
jgi:hypothetical protein